jgi:polyribonucleotide 5'-hydroxyl-kinase
VKLLAGASDDTGASSSSETAEMLGCDVKPAVWHAMPPGRSVSLYTHTGCTVAVAADATTLQQLIVAPPTASLIRGAAELHYSLEEARVAAKKAMDSGDEAAVGPRVLVCSARASCGKSTLVQLLANYATRLRYHPIVIDLDPDCPSCGAHPETIAAHCLQYPVDVSEGYCLAPSGLHFLYGSREFSRNVPLMMELCRSVSDACISRQSRFPRSRIGGLFIDYPTVDVQSVLEAEEVLDSRPDGGSRHVRPNPIDQLINTLTVFDVDVVVVIGADWLKQKLHRTCAERYGGDAGSSGSGFPAADCGRLALPGQASARLISFPACEHAVVRSPLVKDALRRQQWMDYLFGSASSPVVPSLLSLDLSKVRLAVVGAIVEEAMHGLLPMEDDSASGPEGGSPRPAKQVQEVTAADVKLPGRIVAISDASSLRVLPGGHQQEAPLSYDQFYREVGRCTVAGFALVREVTPTTIVLLAPNAGLPLQRNSLTCLLLTDTFLNVR